MLSTIALNGSLLLADALVIRGIRRQPQPKTVLIGCCGLLIISIILAVIFGHNFFDHMRLMSFALFGHINVVFFASAYFLRSRKVAFSVLLCSGLALAFVALYSFVVEPQLLEVTTLEITTTKVSKPLRIAILADLQTDQFGEHEKKALLLVVQQHPDMILLTGDYFQTDDVILRQSLISAANQYLKRINLVTPLGAYAIRGDVDSDEWVSTFHGTDVTVFEESETFRKGELLLTALDRSDSRKTDLRIPCSNQFHIVFGHSPNFALGDIQADLLIAGHTHGGQLRLPFIGPVYVHSKIPRKWAAGMTDLSGNRKLVVSRGIGMERGFAPRIRFLCRPELVVIRLVPKSF